MSKQTLVSIPSCVRHIWTSYFERHNFLRRFFLISDAYMCSWRASVSFQTAKTQRSPANLDRAKDVKKFFNALCARHVCCCWHDVLLRRRRAEDIMTHRVCETYSLCGLIFMSATAKRRSTCGRPAAFGASGVFIPTRRYAVGVVITQINKYGPRWWLYYMAIVHTTHKAY